MELNVRDLDNNEKGKIKLPVQFNELFRPDLIKRAVEAVQSGVRQPYGADPRAGKRSSAKLSKRRRRYRGCYGKGIARVPRKIMTRRGMQFNWTGAFAPMTVGGRRAHPPKSERVWVRKINDRERKKALRSAIAATMMRDVVKTRGHMVPDSYPFVLSDDFEKLSKTKQVRDALLRMGLKSELDRSSVKSVRAGKGKGRGRKYKKAKGILFVVGKDCEAMRSVKNIAGSDVVEVSRLNAELLAPGCHAGRLTLFTRGAIERLGKERLFV